MFAEMFHQLGFWGTFIPLMFLIILIGSVAGYLILQYGLSNPLNGNRILTGRMTPQAAAPSQVASSGSQVVQNGDQQTELALVSDEYSAYTMVGTEKIGFKIPEPHVVIYGNLWNKSHIPLYGVLDRLWTAGNTVELRCNITSPLVSLLEDKAKQFGSLNIIALSDQMVLLNVFENYENIHIQTK